MNDDLANDPFSDLLGGDTQQPAAPETPLAPPVSGAPENDPFADLLAAPPAEETSGFSAFMHNFNRSLAPAAGSLVAAGYGAEVGFVAGGPLGSFAGALIGGFGGASAINTAQEFALQAMPEEWRDFLGQSEKTRTKEATEHPTESFLGGAVPYLLTMKPFGAPASLPANSTALQRILANPTTGRIFSGALNGGLEVVMEAGAGHVDPKNVAIATGLGVLFPHANRLGVKLSNMGATAARSTIPAVGLRAAQAEIAARKAPVVEAAPEVPVREPTVAEAGDLRVMGPGITEEVFMGTREPSPHAAQTAQEAARAEAIALNPEVGRGDVRTVARQMEPELFGEYEALSVQRSDLRAALDAASGSTMGEPSFYEAQLREQLAVVDSQMREMAPQIAAAHRRSADYVTAETVEDTTPATLETEAVAQREAAEAAGLPPIEAQLAAIAEDVTRSMIAAGRPEAEARAAGQLLSNRYLTRARRIGRNDPLALYNTEGPVIRGNRRGPVTPRAPLMPTINEPSIGRVAEPIVAEQSTVPAAPNEAKPAQNAPSEIESIRPADIEVDAKRFQFKAGGDEAGVTERLQGVTDWDARLAGTALVWRDENGKNWIADGHQRLGLAKRLSETNPNIRINAFVLNSADGVTDAQARAIAAIKNIAEGTGSPVDAAKVLRAAEESGIDLPPLPPRSALVRDGRALAQLSPEAFGIVVNEAVPPATGAIVGRMVKEGPAQVEALKLLAQMKPDNAQQAEMIVRDMLSSGTEMTTQGTLFGEEAFASSIVRERAKIADEAMKLLRRDRATFRTLVDEAERIQGAGQNILDQEANQGRLSTDEQASDLLKRLAFRTGPVSDALSEVARKLKSGDIKSGEAARTFLGDVRRAVEAGVDTGADVGGAEPGAVAERPQLDNEGPALFQSARPYAVKPPKKLYRGIVEGQQESGAEGLGTAHLGRGLYSSPDRSFAKKYATNGRIVELTPEQAWPRNPLVLRGAGGAGNLLNDWIFQNTDYRNIRDFNKDWPDPAEFVKSKGYDGVIAGDEVVRYPDAPGAKILFQSKPDGNDFFQRAKPQLWREGDMLGEFNTERGLEGLPQAVIPGTEVTEATRIAAEANKPLTGGAAPLPKGGLFDVEGRQAEADQLTLFQSAPPEDSPAFERWFGDSKVVDESGAPRKVFHGSPNGVPEAFDPSKIGTATDSGDLGRGFYFTPNFRHAEVYAADADGVMQSRDVTRAYLALKNPLREMTPDFTAAVDKRVADAMAAEPSATAEGWASVQPGPEQREPAIRAQAITDEAKARGYDGVWMNNPRFGYEEIVAFEPTQIKHVDNRGTFDPNDPRIYYQPAYHGTPHIFDKFDSSKIGTGEGAQAFGHGLYFAGKKEVAQYYRDALGGWDRKHLMDGEAVDFAALPDKERFAFMAAAQNPKATADQLVRMTIENGARDEIAEGYRPLFEKYAGHATIAETPKGRLLTVDIPSDDELLVWDAPLSEQSDAVKKALGDRAFEQMPLFDGKPLAEFAPEAPSVLRAVVATHLLKNGDLEAAITEMTNRAYDGAARSGNDAIVKAAHALGDKLHSGKLTLEKVPSRELGSAFYDRLKAEFGSPQAASNFLREAGIPGHKFLDQQSRNPKALADAKAGLAKWEDRLKQTPDDAYVRDEVEARRAEVAKMESELSYNYVIYDDSRINVTAYEQGKRGSITFKEGQKPLIKLFEDADASTFFHETGHQWLEELMRDATHEQATDILKTDAGTVRKWLGIGDDGKIQTAQHEKFARGFEQYLREGVAPSAGLARVFAQFKNWLVSIYQSMRGLGAPINDDIKQVFDRMIELEPQRTVIAPESEAPRGMADLHSNDAEMIPAEEAEPAMDRVLSERDRAIAEMPVEVRNELEAASAAFAAPDAGGEAGAGPGGSDEVVGAGGIAEPVAPSAARGGEPGAVDGGGGEAGPESAGPPPAPAPEPGLRDNGPGAADAARANPLAPEPAALYGASDDPLIDKAGNIRLDNLTDDVDVRKAIHASAAANHDFIGDRRGVITQGQQQDLAEALGMTADTLSQRKLGEAFNAEQVWAARKLLIQSGETVVALAKRAATGGDQDVLAYAQAAERHRMIQSQIAGITAEAGRALAAFRNMKGTVSTKSLDQLLRESTAKTLFQLKQEAALGALLDSPQAVSKFMIEKAEKKGVLAGALEWWINALVSGPRTHVTNIVSNTLFGLQRMGPDTIAAAALGEIRQALGQKRQRVQFAEVGAKFARLPEASATGAVAAIDALKAGKGVDLPSEQMQPELPYQPGSELATAPQLDLDATAADILPRAFGLTRGILDSMIATGKLVGAGGEAGAPLLGLKRSPLGIIPDIQYRGATVAPAGTLARLPTRLLAAEDSFFRSVLYRTEIGSLAVRQAMAEGLTGASRETRIADLYQNPTKDMMELAVREAQAGTFTARRSKFVNMLTQLANQNIGGFPLLRFIIPFINTPANILEQTALHRTPLGLALKGEVQNDLLGRNGDVAQDQAWGRLLVGTAYIIGFGALAAQGYLNGSGPSDPSERAAWRMAGNQPNSVRIGDTWFDMRALGPLGLLASMSADSIDVAKVATEGDASAVASNLMNAVTQNFLNASFMTGPSDFIQAVQNPDRYGEAYIEKLVSSFTVPSLVAQPARAMDPYLRDVQGTLDAIKARTPLSTGLQPRIDIWGNPISSGTSFGPGGISPIYTTQLSKDPVTLYLASSGYWPAPVQRKIRGVELTPSQYVEYATLAGRMAKSRLDTIVTSPQFAQWPPNSRLDVVREVIAQSRETARGYMIVRNPQLAIDAVRLKQGATAENLN